MRAIPGTNSEELAWSRIDTHRRLLDSVKGQRVNTRRMQKASITEITGRSWTSRTLPYGDWIRGLAGGAAHKQVKVSNNKLGH